MFWLDRPEYPGLPEVLSQDKVGVETLGHTSEMQRFDPRQSLSDIMEQDRMWIREEDVSLSKRKKSFRDPQQQQQPEKSMSNYQQIY